MKRYSVIDAQGANFMDYTWKEPITKNEFRAIRWSDYKNWYMEDPENDMTWQCFTSDFACEFWQVELEEVRQ